VVSKSLVNEWSRRESVYESLYHVKLGNAIGKFAERVWVRTSFTRPESHSYFVLCVHLELEISFRPSDSSIVYTHTRSATSIPYPLAKRKCSAGYMEGKQRVDLTAGYFEWPIRRREVYCRRNLYRLR
jgi:hypothetical protein